MAVATQIVARDSLGLPDVPDDIPAAKEVHSSQAADIRLQRLDFGCFPMPSLHPSRPGV
jgi:hypothetical protein